MDIGEAKRLTGPRRRRKRVGRGTGSGHGKTCGRGHKGARSRSGWSSRGMTGGPLPLWRRIAQRGFTNAPFRKPYGIVNVEDLDRFDEGTVVTPEVLKEHGVVKQPGAGGVKVLGSGEITTALTVRAHAFSGSAVAKIEAAGGRAEVIPGPRPPVRRRMGAGARRTAVPKPQAHEG